MAVKSEWRINIFNILDFKFSSPHLDSEQYKRVISNKPDINSPVIAEKNTIKKKTTNKNKNKTKQNKQTKKKQKKNKLE